MEEEGILLVAARASSAQCGHTRETCLNKYIRKFIRKQNVYVSFHEEKKRGNFVASFNTKETNQSIPPHKLTRIIHGRE